MLRRNIEATLTAALADTPIVFLNGARQTGKSTLVQWLLRHGYRARYQTLDDATVLSAARLDPHAFVEAEDRPLAIDEVQRAPELFLAIKAAVDRDRRPGRFLLTGSADVLVLPKLAEALAGRMEVATLWPLSCGEIAGTTESFIDAAFEGLKTDWSERASYRSRLIDTILAGGYPEAVSRSSEARRAAWFRSYVSTLLQREVSDLARIEGVAALPRLLALLAAQAGGMLNASDVSRRLAVPHSTLTRYLALLEATFLVQLVPAWSANLGTRLVKAPKVFLDDCGLLAHLQGVDAARLSAEPALLGPLFENFVVMELKKQQGWAEVKTTLYHFRTHTGREADIVLESSAGKLVAIEVKAASSVNPGDFTGLAALAEALPRRFERGIVLYTGTQCVPFGSKLVALPATALWRQGE